MSFDVFYDGTTLTIDKKMNFAIGIIAWGSSNGVLVNNGKLAINLYSAEAVDTSFDVIFRGEYYI